MSVWDNPLLQPPVEDYVRLDNVGDGFTGTIIKVIAQPFDDGSVAPQLTFLDAADGMERSWTAGQVQSKRLLAELRPDTGDVITVRLTGVEKRGGGKTLKHISITVDSRAGQQPPTNGNGHTAAPTTNTTSAPQATIHQLPTHQAQPPFASQQPAYQAAPPPVYATNGGGEAPAPAEPPPPAGVDPAVWQRMDGAQRQTLLAVLGNVPAF